MRLSRFEWDGRDPGALAAELRALQPPLEQVSDEVATIIADVAERGDAAVLELDRRFTGVSRTSPLVPPKLVDGALELVPELTEALRYAAGEIRRVAEAEAAAEGESESEGAAGQRVSMRSVPVSAAGAYVPGGRASYPSSAMMCCIPARAAGVERVAVSSPPGPDGDPDRLVLAACALAGADDVYAMGGVQAIAALALGTETVQPVDVIVGPGNRYVQEAKRQLFGRVGIEGIAGPSELMVALGVGANLRWAALDLCAQVEHGPDGLAVATATEDRVLGELEAQVRDIADAPDSTVSDGPIALVAVPSLAAAVDLANALAPEHLQLAFDDAEELAGGVETAGCVLVGPAAGTAFGDFAAGSNHVLPTGGAGRFSGPLGPRAFRRRIATVRISPQAARGLVPPVATLAGAEGFPLHRESAEARLPESPFPPSQEIR